MSVMQIMDPAKSPLLGLAGEAGEVIKLAPGTQVPLDDTDSIMFVRSGDLEVFGIQRTDGLQTGPREFLCEINPGGLVCGVPKGEGGEVSLLALAIGETTLVRIPLDRLQEVQADPTFPRAMADALDQWIVGLSMGVTRFLQPRQATKLWVGAGEEIAIGENERASSHKGVVWVHLIDGNGRYIDICELDSSSGSTMVPLTNHTWLREDGVRTLRGFPTEVVLRVAGWRKRLDAFHGWVGYALRFNYRNSAAAEKTRLDRRSSQIATDTEKTLFKFAELLSAKAPYRPGIDAEDALYECCAIVGASLGLKMVPPPSARRKRTEDPPLTIEDIARYSLVRARQVALRGEWWAEDNGPLVGFLKDDRRPVALVEKDGKYTYTEPVAGVSVVVTDDNAGALSPVAYTFYPPLPDRKVKIADLLAFGLSRCKFDVFIVLLTGALGGLVGTGIPIATGYVFDTIIPGSQHSQLIQVGLALLVGALSMAVFRLTSDIATLRMEGKVAGILQASVLDRLLRLPNTFFANYSAGDLASRVMVIESVRKALTGVVMASVLAGVFSTFSFALLFYYEPMAALLATLLLLMMLGLTFVTGAAQLSAVLQGEAMVGNLNSMVLEIISGITKLRLAGAEERAFNRWGNDFGEMRKRMVKSKAITNRFTVFSGWYEVMCSVAIYAMIAYMASDTMTTGAFLAFIGAFTSFLGSVGQMSRAIIMVYQVAPLWTRAEPIMNALPENTGNKADPGQLTGAFEITQATFRYSQNLPRVLNGLTIKGEPGEFIAVVGPSGSGKSTVMKLLLGFEKPETGTVLFDGQDVKGLDLQLVRRQIGVVLQSGRLMPGTIYENIKGATQATVDDAWEASRMAGLEGDIKEMPMGMHTVLTEGTAALSGGQVQRILLARAIVAKPRLLLLDEATSALDNRTQAVVTESLDRLSVTRVVIAHRLSTIMKADRIYVVKEGKVAETGGYEELMARNGVFAELARRQQL